MSSNRVRPFGRRLTDADARHLLADGLLRTCHKLGPSRVGIEVGCDEKTIRRARDEHSTLHLHCVINLLDVDSHALDALLGAKGYMLAPLIASGDDIIPAAGAAIHCVGQNRSRSSQGGSTETDAELMGSEEENDALLASVLERRAEIVRAKLRRAA